MANGVVWDDEQKPAGGVVWDDETKAASAEDPNNTLFGSTGPIRTRISAMRQGVTMGVGSGFAGAADTALQGAAGLVGAENSAPVKYLTNGPAPTGSLLDRFEANRDREKLTEEQQGKNYPLTKGASNFAGSLLNPVNYIKAPASVVGGALGGLQANIQSEHPILEDPLGRAKDVWTGTAIGAGAGLVLQGIGAGAGHLAKRWSPLMANKAAGAIQSDLKAAGMVGPGGEDKAVAVGRKLIDEGMVRPLRGLKSTQEAISNALDNDAGPAIGHFLKNADAAANSGAARPFDWQPVIKRIESEVFKPLNAVDESAAKGALSVFEDVEREAARGGGYAVANDVKGSIQGRINYAPGDPPIDNAVKRRIATILKEEVENQGEAALGKSDADAFKAAKDTYGKLATALKWTEKGLGREMGNREISLSDYLAFVAGHSATGGPGGVALGLANKGLRKYGASVAAFAPAYVDRALQSGAGPFAEMTVKQKIQAYLDEMKDQP